MARPRQFDRDEVLDAALGVFREHGYAGSSADMLAGAMRIGKQSLYNAFGDKWALYCTTLERYSSAETAAHVAELKAGASALTGIEMLLARVVKEAALPCLGVGSICEFGAEREGSEELSNIRKVAGRQLRTALVKAIGQAVADGDLSAELDERHAAAFLLANVAAIRLAARSGAGNAELHALARLALRALR